MGGRWDDTLPYSIYNITIVETLKGVKEEKGVICFAGGYDWFHNLKVYSFNSEMLQENQYYLFCTYKKSSSSANNRIRSDEYIITFAPQKTLLIDYVDDKSYQDQSTSIKDIVDPYVKAITMT